jgi:carbon-monoxide dehydrogenase medium subunit
MFPGSFDYIRTASVEEAIALLEQYGDDARPLAGGQSLIPLMKLRLANPTVLVDLNPVPGLDYIRTDDGSVRIGALTRHADVEQWDQLPALMPIVHDAVVLVGDAQVRNLGTVVGAMAEADPGGDWGPVVLALGGDLSCVGPAGARTIPVTDFFTDYYTTALEPTELITELRLQLSPAGSGGAYLKLERRAGDFAVVGVAVQLTVDARGMCQEIGIGLSGVGPTPTKPTAAEAILRGSPLDEAAIDDAVRAIESAIDPVSDVRASAEYRRDMTGVYFRRALARARTRANASPSARGRPSASEAN